MHVMVGKKRFNLLWHHDRPIPPSATRPRSPPPKKTTDHSCFMEGSDGSESVEVLYKYRIMYNKKLSLQKVGFMFLKIQTSCASAGRRENSLSHSFPTSRRERPAESAIRALIRLDSQFASMLANFAGVLCVQGPYSDRRGCWQVTCCQVVR